MAALVLRTRHGALFNEICVKGEISRGDALPETFEDKYYEALMYLCILYLHKNQNKAKNKSIEEAN